jgi:Domain of unknown function (DUF4349)
MKKLTIILMAAIIFTSCKSSFNKVSPSYNRPSANDYQKRVYAASTGRTVGSTTENEPRIVIYNASLKLFVKIPDSTNIRLAEIAQKYEGYVQTLGNKESVIRVKSDKLYAAIADVSVLGKVKSKTISGDDITDQYTDFQIRLENAKNARIRYLELLSKAENVEAALKVEKELERLNVEIDALEGKLKRLQHLVVHSTITVYMEQKVKPGIIGYIGIGLYKSVKWLFVRG